MKKKEAQVAPAQKLYHHGRGLAAAGQGQNQKYAAYSQPPPPPPDRRAAKAGGATFAVQSVSTVTTTGATLSGHRICTVNEQLSRGHLQERKSTERGKGSVQRKQQIQFSCAMERSKDAIARGPYSVIRKMQSASGGKARKRINSHRRQRRAIARRLGASPVDNAGCTSRGPLCAHGITTKHALEHLIQPALVWGEKETRNETEHKKLHTAWRNLLPAQEKVHPRVADWMQRNFHLPRA